MSRWLALLGLAGALGVTGVAAQVAPAATPPPQGGQTGSSGAAGASGAATQAPATGSSSRPAGGYDDIWERAMQGVPTQRTDERGPRVSGTDFRGMFQTDRDLESVAPRPSPLQTDEVDEREASKSKNWLFEAFNLAEEENRRGGRDRDRERDRSGNTGREVSPDRGGDRDSSGGAGRLTLMDLVRREESRQREAESRRQEREREREQARKNEVAAGPAPGGSGDTSSGAGQAGGRQDAPPAEDPARLFEEQDALARLHQRLLFGTDSAADAVRQRQAAALRDNPYTGESSSSRSAGGQTEVDATWAAAAAVASRGSAAAGTDGAGRFRSLGAEEQARRAVADAAAFVVGDMRPEERVGTGHGPIAPVLPLDIRDPANAGGWTPPPASIIPEDRRFYRHEPRNDNEKYFPQLQRF